MKQIIDEGDLVASNLKFGKSNTVSVGGGIYVQLGSDKARSGGDIKNISEHTSTMSAMKDEQECQAEDDAKLEATEKKKKKAKKGKAKKGAARSNEGATADEEKNPWMTATSVRSRTKMSVLSFSAMLFPRVNLKREAPRIPLRTQS